MSADVAVEILRARYGGAGPATVHETWGASIVVEVDGLFLKASGDRSTRAEALVAQKARAAGVPAPEVIASGVDARLPGGTWIVMPRMPGTSFDARSATEEQIDRVVADVARCLEMLSGIRMPGWGWVGDDGCGTSPSWGEWLNGQIVESADKLGDRLPGDFLDRATGLIDRVAGQLSHGSLLNGDLGLSHVLVDPPTGAVTGLLDWAAAVIGDPLLDMATFSMGGPAGDPTHAVLQPRLLAACGIEPDDPRIALYRAVNHLSNAVWSIENDVTSWTADLCAAAVDLVG